MRSFLYKLLLNKWADISLADESLSYSFSSLPPLCFFHLSHTVILLTSVLMVLQHMFPSPESIFCQISNFLHFLKSLLCSHPFKGLSPYHSTSYCKLSSLPGIPHDLTLLLFFSFGLYHLLHTVKLMFYYVYCSLFIYPCWALSSTVQGSFFWYLM